MGAIMKLFTSDSVKFEIFNLPSFKTKNAKKNQDKVTYIIMKYGPSEIKTYGLLLARLLEN
jgi:hypothetical protein